MPRRSLRRAALVVALTLVFGACGGDGDDAPGETFSDATTTTQGLAAWTQTIRLPVAQLALTFATFELYRASMAAGRPPAVDVFAQECAKLPGHTAAIRSKLPSPDFVLNNRLESVLGGLEVAGTTCRGADRDAAIRSLARLRLEMDEAVSSLGLSVT